jgi:hypothetical protein
MLSKHKIALLDVDSDSDSDADSDAMHNDDLVIKYEGSIQHE